MNSDNVHELPQEILLIVYIDPAQIPLQKKNSYNLYIAKKVNGSYTVIWQSFLPIAAAGKPSYGYRNVFNVEIPSYKVNYTTDPVTHGSVTFSSGGVDTDIALGQVTMLDPYGLFTQAKNGGTPGQITIMNSLQNNPHSLLMDENGNNIFVNLKSGMDIGKETLTVESLYQVWFYARQANGTIIAKDIGLVGEVDFAVGKTNKSITYTSQGTWEQGEPANLAQRNRLMGKIPPQSELEDIDLVINVTVLFTIAVTGAAFTYLSTQFINKFSGNLKPKKVHVKAGGMEMLVEFPATSPGNGETVSFSDYDKAVDDQLRNSVNELPPGEKWSFDDIATTAISVPVDR